MHYPIIDAIQSMTGKGDDNALEKVTRQRMIEKAILESGNERLSGKEADTMKKPILYYWGPCPTCATVVDFAEKNGIELDKRDIEQEEPYQELLSLGGDGNLIPYLSDGDQLINGNDEIIDYLAEKNR